MTTLRPPPAKIGLELVGPMAVRTARTFRELPRLHEAPDSATVEMQSPPNLSKRYALLVEIHYLMITLQTPLSGGGATLW